MTHISTTELMGRLWREHIRTYAGWLILAVVFMAIVAACTTFSAYLMKPIVNDIFVNRDKDMLWLIGGAVFVVFIIKGVATYSQQVLMSKVGMRIVADLQNRLYRHLTDLDISFFHANATGTLVSRFTVDITSMRVAVSHAITVFGKDLLSLIGLVANMFWQDWQLALIAIFVFPVAISPIAKIGRRMRKVTVNSQVETGQLMTTLEQTFQGIRMVKAYSMEDYERGRVADLVEKLFGLSYKGARTRAMSSPIMETLGGVAIGIIIIYGGYRVIQDATDPGSFFSFITALLLAYEPMKRLANLNATVQEGLAGAQRTYKVLDTVSAIQEVEGAKSLDVAGGKIQLENVSFSYPKSNDDGFHETALNNIDITIPAGKTVALVGASGAGHAAKIANNMLCAANLVLVAEAVRMCEAAGVDAEGLLEGVNAGSGRSGVSEVNFPKWILNGAFDSGFTMGLMRKDVGLALDLAKQTGVHLDGFKGIADIWLHQSGDVPFHDEKPSV